MGAGRSDGKRRAASSLQNRVRSGRCSSAEPTQHANGPAISRERHRAALAQAGEALDSARAAAIASMPPEIVAVDIALATEALGSITGTISSEDILDAIFRQFCIGK